MAALHVGPRTQEPAHAVVHTLKHVLAPCCMPVFTSDGLALCFYALTSHFGQWVQEAHSRARGWQVSAQLLYGQVKKHNHRWRVQRVEQRAMLGSVEQIKAALLTLGFSGTIQTALVERFNATLRHDVSTLVRRTCGKAQLAGEMTLHLEWFRAYYQFVCPHGGLREAMQTPMQLRGRMQHYHQRTPAMVAGIALRRWSVLEVAQLVKGCCPFLYRLAQDQTTTRGCDSGKNRKTQDRERNKISPWVRSQGWARAETLTRGASQFSPVFCGATACRAITGFERCRKRTSVASELQMRPMFVC